jgi:hypothetical protein
MAERQYLRNFSFEHTGEGSAVIESGGSLQKIAAGGGGEKIRKTVWQNVRTPPVIPGDTFTVDGTLATCDQVSVTDEVVSIEGSTPIRIWKIDIEGHTGGPGTPEDLEASSGKYLEGYSSEIPRNSFVIVEDNGTLAKHDGPTVRTTLSKTVWQTNSIPPVETGAGYSFNGVSGIVERVSVSDEVISIAGGTPTRLWKFEIEGFAGSEDGDEDLEGASGRYFEEHGSEISRSSFVLVEDNGSLVKQDGPIARRSLSKSVWQTDSTPPVAVGGEYSFNGVSGIVEKISVSDEVIAIDGGVPTRIWKFDIEGFAGSENGDEDLETASGRYFEEHGSETPRNSFFIVEDNGSLVKQDGPAVRTTLSKIVWQSDSIPPVVAGAEYSFNGVPGIVDKVSVSDEVIAIDGGTPKRIWKFEINGFAGTENGDEDLDTASGKYFEEHSSETPRNGFVILENNGNLVKQDGAPVRMDLSKTVWQTDPTPPIAAGAEYSFNGVSGIVEKVSVSDEVISIADGAPTRIWKFEIKGFAGSPGAPEDLETASGKYFEEYSSEIPRRGFVLVEDNGSLTKQDGASVRINLSKTVWQTDSTPPVATGAEYSFNGVSGIVERVSVSDEVISIAGGTPNRIWKFDIEGFAGSENSDENLETASGKYFEEHGTEIPRREFLLVENGGSLAKVDGAPVRKSLSKTIWQTDSTPPVAVGALYSFNGSSGIVEKISVSDEVISISGGTPTRLWKFDIEGFEGSENGDADLESAGRKYYETTEISESVSEGISYEDYSGIRHVVQESNSGRRVSKTVWQQTMTPPLSVGDQFSAGGISAICTRISITDEVISIGSGVPVRLWRIDLDGVEGGTASPARYLREKSISRKLNGTVETALNGETVILKRSDIPITTVHVVAYTETDTPPVLVGASLEGGIVTEVDTIKTVVESDGMKIAEIYRHEMDVAL